MNITENVMAILSQCSCEDDLIRLPDGQLDRASYVAVNKVLEMIGGKWNRRRAAHVLGGDAQDALDQVLMTGIVQNKRQELGFFETPAAIVDQMIALSDLSVTHRALEPSAGRGAIAVKIAPLVGHLDCWEIDSAHPLSLVKAMTAAHVNVFYGDFLAQTFAESLPYDRILMNPPFARQADIKHVLHAHGALATNGVLVSVMSAGASFRLDRAAREFRDYVRAHNGALMALPEGSFRVSGTDVNTILATIPGRAP